MTPPRFCLVRQHTDGLRLEAYLAYRQPGWGHIMSNFNQSGKRVTDIEFVAVATAAIPRTAANQAGGGGLLPGT